MPAPASRRLLVHAAAVVDGSGFCAAPGAVLIELAAASLPGSPFAVRLLAAGLPAAVAAHEAAAGAGVVRHDDAVLIPALVNAHTHLDLTHIGPQPHDPAAPGGFGAWIDLVRRRRATDHAAIAASVAAGVALARAGGTAAIGDIAGFVAGWKGLAAASALAASPAVGVSFVEFFAQGPGEAGRIAELRERAAREFDAIATPRVGVGLHPHAPYSVGPAAYDAALALAAGRGLPICTHLAESAEERAFVAEARGPLVDLLRQLNLWTEAAAAPYGRGLSPVAHVAAIARGRPMTAVHVNDASDADIAALASAGASVVYCPRASAYFAAERAFGPHRYGDMLAAGINVALGTDSLVNLPPVAADAATGGISVLDEVRLLQRRDGADPRALLAMATTRGARALGLDPRAFEFGEPAGGPAGGPHPIAGVLAVPVAAGWTDAWRAVGASASPARVVALG